MNIKLRLEKLEKTIKSKLEEYCKLIPPLVIIIDDGENTDEKINAEKTKRCEVMAGDLSISFEEAREILAKKVPVIIINLKSKPKEGSAD